MPVVTPPYADKLTTKREKFIKIVAYLLFDPLALEF